MTNTFTPLIGLNEIGTGNDIDTWGDVETANKLITEQAIKGVLTLSVSGSYTLNYTTDTTDQSHFAILNISNGAGGTVVLQPVQSQFLVYNNASGDVVFQMAANGTSAAVLHPGDCTYILNDGVSAVRQLGTAGVAVSDQIRIALANARSYTDETAFAMDSGEFPGMPNNAGSYLHTDGNSAMWRLITSSDIGDLSNITVAKAGDTMTGSLGFANTTGQIGRMCNSGVHMGANTIALRAISNSSNIALQSYAGANTFATVSAAGADFQVPLTNYGNAVWTTGTLTPSDYQLALGFTPLSNAGGDVGGNLTFSAALSIGEGIASGLSGDGTTVALRSYSTGPIVLQAANAASTYATVSGAGADFSVPLTANGSAVWTAATLNPASFQASGEYQSPLGFTPANRAGDTFGGHVGVSFTPAGGSYDAGEMVNLTNPGLTGEQRTIGLGTSPNGNGYVRAPHGSLDLVAGGGLAATFSGSSITFSSRPTWNGASPWDTANLNLADYQLAGNYQPAGSYQPAGNYLTPDSPVLTGTPTAPTQNVGDNSGKIATTAYVQSEIAANPSGYVTNTGLNSKGFLTGANFQVNFVAAENGSMQNPNGIIDQWGYVASPVGSNGSEDEMSIITFGTAFPNNCWNVQLTPKLSAPSGNADIWGQVLNLTPSGFTIYFQGSSSGTVAGMYWRAIGN